LNKKNSYDYKKILILISLMIIFSLSFIMPSIYTNENGYFDNPNDDTIKELENNDLKSQGLTSDNVYSGIGTAWNLTHWANRTDNNLEVSFENDSYDIKNMPLDSGWIGYKLNATIDELYDKRNWVNGTFHAGPDDDDNSCPEDDSNYLQNWTFGYIDVLSGSPGPYTNPMSGNYFDINDDPSGTSNDCLELRMNGGDIGNTGYDKYDRCWWESNFTLPRGKVIEGEINLVIYPYTQYYETREFGTHWSIQIILNGIVIDDKNLIWLEDSGGDDWYPLKLQLTNWLDDPTVFPNNEKNMSLRIQLIRNGPTFNHGPYGTYQEVLFDNVSLIVKAEVKPTQISLNMNQTAVSNSTNWGEGTVEIDGNWNGTQYPWVHANFNSSEIWPSELGGYNITFKTDLNLFAIKHSPETNYETNAALLGTLFSVSNNSLVDWECYGYTSVPTGYAETEMKLEFPTDVNITWISYPSDPLTNKLDLCDNSTAGLLIVNVSKISETPDGFWKFDALSPNYCEQLNIYNNATGSWIENTEFLSGEYINISAVITNNSLISDYIQDTNATLQIRFPNGTIWSDKTQEKNPIANGSVYFDPILIPSTSPAYEVGEYDAIITWNNSHSIYGLNETGIIYKKFTVIHNSTLIPDQSYYADIFEGTSINLKVSFNDLKDGKAIEGAVVYTYNFTHPSIMQNFSEISPGYYVLLDFNVSGGDPGENNITIYANSSLYTNNQVNVTIELILETTLTAEEYPYLQVPWNQNFTLHLNYTEKKSGDGITTTPIVNWNGDTHTVMDDPGEYNITCNSSAYEVNKLHSLIIDVDEYGYEPQSILIKIEIIEREAYLDDIFINGSDCTSNKSYNVKAGVFLNITVKFKDNETSGTFINNATVKLIGTDVDKNFNESISFQHYNLTLNLTELGVGVKFLTITTQKDNYTSASELLTITVFERGTNYILYLNETDSTSDPSYQLTDNQLLNIIVSYIDTILTEHISGATVDINGSGISKQFVEAFNNYSVEINSTDLNQGVNFLTIYAQKETYEPQSILITIEVIQIGTNLTLYKNRTDITAVPSIKQYTNEILNITVSYQDAKIPDKHISGAIVDINGSGISEQLNEAFNNYSVLINMADLNQGANFLTIYARKDKYEPQTILLTIEIIQIETNLTLYKNGIDITAIPSIKQYTNQILNITVSYKEATGPYKHVSGAIVDINGSEISKVFNELGTNYSVLIDTTNLNQGANFLTIYARKENFEPQTILLTIEIIQIETDLKLFLNGVDKTNEPSIDVITLETLNITIKYTTYGTGVHISNATIELSGNGLLINISENLDLKQYSFIINTIDLNVGFNFLTVYAQKSNYEAQTVLITIQLIERKAYDEIYLDNEDKTLEKSIETPIGKELNITFKYFDDITGNHIPQALVQLIGAKYTWNFTENNSLKQYSLIIDTTELDIGLKFLTIYAQRTYYQSSSELLKITVRQIITNITTESGEDVVNIQAGEPYTLSIILYDLDFGELIKNVTVRYTWELGQGYLTDEDNDGIYKATLENIPPGTFTFTFTVLNVSDDYLFERKTITLNVVSPPEETLIFLILTIAAIGASIGIGGYFIAYQRVLKYPKPVRKIHKFKKTLKKKKSPDVEILSSKVLLKALYNEELDPVAKLFKGKMKYEQPEKQLELKPSKDELIDTLSEISPEESEKNEK